MKRLYGFAWALACAVISFACLAGVADARKAKAKPKAAANLPVTRGSQYLALGDSVTFGYMEPTVVPPPDYPNAASFVGYPELVASALHLKLANASCPGETSSSFVNPSAPSNGCENNPSGSSANYRTNFPLHVKYSGSQLAYAVNYLKTHHNVRLVSLMIGANDFFRCQETTPDHCQSFSEQASTAGAITANIAKILTGIRKQAHYKGQIVVVDYYSLNYANPVIAHQSMLLDGVENSAAKSFHVKYADGFGAFGAAAAHSAGDSCKAGLLTQLSTGGCGVHPSYSGQALLAHAVEQAIKNG
jgi:lysophospholipase L1-like esterase